MPSSSASATSLRRGSALAYDVRGDGRMKLYGSWGRYFDWTKYELARGSFGGDFWRVYYRSLDTLDIASLGLTNMPGRDLWGSATGFRNRRVNFAGNVDPDIKPMSQDSTSVGVEYQLWGNTVLGVHYVHNDLRRTIEDIGALDANGDEAYVIGNPGEFLSRIRGTVRSARRSDSRCRRRSASTMRLNSASRGGSANRWFFSGNYTYSRLYGNYPGISSSDEIRTPTTNITSPAAQQQLGNVFRQGGNAEPGVGHRLSELGLARNPRRPGQAGHRSSACGETLRVVSIPDRDAGWRVLLRWQRHADQHLRHDHRPDPGVREWPRRSGPHARVSREPTSSCLTSSGCMGSQRVRLELNVLNLFNQKTATHIYNQLNRGPSGLPRQASAIPLSGVDLRNGYDYDALIRATADGANAYDPRFGQEDLFNPGLQGQFSVKFMF